MILAVRAPLWLSRGPKRAPKAAQRRFCDILLGFLVSFGEPRGALWGSFGRQSLQPGAFMSIFRCFCGVSKKGSKKVPKVV